MHEITASDPCFKSGFYVRLHYRVRVGDFCIHFFSYSPSFLPVSCRFVSLLLSTGLVPSAVFCALNSPELADRNNDILRRKCYFSHSIGNTEDRYPTGWDVSLLEISLPNQTELGYTNTSPIYIYIYTHIYTVGERGTLKTTCFE